MNNSIHCNIPAVNVALLKHMMLKFAFERCWLNLILKL